MAKIITVEYLVADASPEAIKKVFTDGAESSLDGKFLIDFQITNFADAIPEISDAIANGTFQRGSPIKQNVNLGVAEVVEYEGNYFTDPGLEDFLTVMQRDEAELNEMIKKSNELPDGEIVGGILTFPMADGQAFYRVKSDIPLILEHIPYGDCWHASEVTIRGITTDYIKDTLAKSRKRSEMFKNK